MVCHASIKSTQPPFLSSDFGYPPSPSEQMSCITSSLHDFQDELLLPLRVRHRRDQVHRVRQVGAEGLGKPEIRSNQDYFFLESSKWFNLRSESSWTTICFTVYVLKQDVIVGGQVHMTSTRRGEGDEGS